VKGNFVKRIPISDPARPLEFNFPIGPVALNAKLNMYAQVDGDFDGTGDVTSRAGVYLAAGLGCGEAIRKGVNEFGPYSKADHDFKISTVGIYPRATLHLNASLMQPEAQPQSGRPGRACRPGSMRCAARRRSRTRTFATWATRSCTIWTGAFKGSLVGRLQLLGIGDPV
jgi:hypothetical protein